MKDRARKYFLLADQYLETSKLLLESLINNDNSNAGFGLTQEEAYEEMRKNVLKSDATLLIPTIFNSYQSLELFLKGLLLFNCIVADNTHEVSDMIAKISGIYGDKSDIYKKIRAFYKEQVDILKNYKKTNNITTTKGLYESLRYSEDNTLTIKEYDYFDLKYNGDFGIRNFKVLLKRLCEVKEVILKEYHEKY